MVDRYIPAIGAVKSDDGAWVKCADYEALEAKLAAAEKRVKELGGLVQQHQTYQTKEGIKS